nr:MAG TPA: Phosphohydrolase [Caudoviricetes sp.]
MATIDEIKQQAAAVKNATQVGENTAERVGGALAGLANIAEQQGSNLIYLSNSTKNVDTYISAKTITLLTGLSNKSIETNGVIVDNGNYNISDPIKLEAKQMIAVEAIANNSSIICKIDTDTISENSKLTPLVVFGSNPTMNIAVYKYIAEEPCYVVVCDRRNLTETNVRIIDYPYIQKSISTALKEVKNMIPLSKDIAIMISYGQKIDITINEKENSKDVTINIPQDFVVACKGKVDYFKKAASVTRTNVNNGILWAIINMDSFDISLQTYSYVPNINEAYLFGIDLLFNNVTSYNPAIFTFNGKPPLNTNDIRHGQDILSSYLNEFHNKYVDTDNLLNVYRNMQEIELSSKLKDYYIAYNGKFVSYNSYDVSSPIQLKKGETILASVSANGVTAIALCDTEDLSLDSKLTSVVYSEDGTIRYFSYSATDDCYVVISGYASTLTKAYKVPTNSIKTSLLAIKESLEQKIDERVPSNDSISYLNDKTIVGNNIVQATRPYSKDMVLSHALCTLSIMTDIHGYQQNLKRYIDFTKEYKQYVDDMLCLGDMVAMTWEDSMDFWSNTESSEKIMMTIGNHDTNAVGSDSDHWYHYAGREAYVRYFKPYISNWNVNQPDNAEANGYCWYYKDYANAKVRLIVLDCMYMSKDTEQAQLQWFASVLTDAKEKGLSVVAAKHYPFSVVQDKDKNTFNSLDFNSYDGNSKSSMKDFLDAIETYISSGGEFICWLNGDSHYDFQGLITDYPNQYAIAFENAGCNSQWNDSVRIEGTKSQDSFNFVTFDTNSKLIKVVRVGNNSDRYLRHKNYICYDYKNKKIITCG